MGRKRNRRILSDDSADSDSDDVDTIIVDSTQKYGLRPRKAPLFVDGLVDEDDENQFQSDFEDELGCDTVITTVRCDTNQGGSLQGPVDYDEVIASDVVGNKDEIDFENVIEKTEIQVLKRKVSDAAPVATTKRRARKAKCQQEPVESETEFCHFLDTRDSKVEEFFGIPDTLECTTENQNSFSQTEQVTAATDDEQIKVGTEVDCSDAVLTEHDRTSAIEGEQEGIIPFMRDSPITEIDYANLHCETEIINPVIDAAEEVDDVEEVLPNWSGIILAMTDKSCFVEHDTEVAVLKEQLPKATFHYLIIPKEYIKSLRDVTFRHIAIIQHMYDTAKKIIAYPQHEGVNFLIGFNALPTMITYNQNFMWLHLHVISDDMNFENLLLKKHWNTIHTKLLIHPEGNFIFL